MTIDSEATEADLSPHAHPLLWTAALVYFETVFKHTLVTDVVRFVRRQANRFYWYAEEPGDAVLCALRARQVCEEYGKRARAMRTVVTTGMCIGFMIVDETEYFGPAADDAVVLAAEIATVGQILVSESMAHALGDWDAVEEGKINLRQRTKHITKMKTKLAYTYAEVQFIKGLTDHAMDEVLARPGVLLPPAKMLEDDEVRDIMRRHIPAGTITLDNSECPAAEAWESAIDSIARPDLREYDEEREEWETVELSAFDTGLAISVGRQWFRPMSLVHFELTDYHRILRQHSLLHALTLLKLMRRYVMIKVTSPLL